MADPAVQHPTLPAVVQIEEEREERASLLGEGANSEGISAHQLSDTSSKPLTTETVEIFSEEATAEASATLPGEHADNSEEIAPIAQISDDTSSQSPANERHDIVEIPDETDQVSSFTWFDAAKLAVSIVFFYYDACTDAKLLVDYYLAGSYWRLILASSILVLWNCITSILCMATELNNGRSLLVLEHERPNWWKRVKLWSRCILMAPPTWYAEELYHVWRSLRARSEEEAKRHLELVRDLQFVNHLMRFFHGAELTFQLTINQFDIGLRLIQQWDSNSLVGVLEGLSVLAQLLGMVLGYDSLLFLYTIFVPRTSAPRRMGGSWLFKAFRILASVLSLCSDFLMQVIYFLYFGLAGTVALCLAATLLLAVQYYQHSNLFVVSSFGGQTGDMLGCVPHTLKRLSSLAFNGHSNILPETVWEALLDVAFDVAAMWIWWRFGPETAEQGTRHVVIAVTPVVLNCLSKAIKVPVNHYERKNQ